MYTLFITFSRFYSLDRWYKQMSTGLNIRCGKFVCSKSGTAPSVAKKSHSFVWKTASWDKNGMFVPSLTVRFDVWTEDSEGKRPNENSLWITKNRGCPQLLPSSVTLTLRVTVQSKLMSMRLPIQTRCCTFSRLDKAHGQQLFLCFVHCILYKFVGINLRVGHSNVTSCNCLNYSSVFG